MVGYTLELICFSQNQLVLHFDRKLTITVISALSHSDPSKLADELIEIPVLQSDLMQLLEHQITRAFGDQHGNLTLEFENGHILRCLDNSRQYESYMIQFGDQEIIV